MYMYITLLTPNGSVYLATLYIHLYINTPFKSKSNSHKTNILPFLSKVWGMARYIPLMLYSVLANPGQMLEQSQIILQFCSSFKLFNLLKPLPFPCGRMANKKPWATGLKPQPHIATDTADLQYFSHTQSLRLNPPEMHHYKEPKTQGSYAWDLTKKPFLFCFHITSNLLFYVHLQKLAAHFLAQKVWLLTKVIAHMPHSFKQIHVLYYII